MTDNREEVPQDLIDGVPIERNPKYWEFKVINSELFVQCKECGKNSPTQLGMQGVLAIRHEPLCMTWLGMRLEAVIHVHKKLKFQLTKLVELPLSGSYPVYVSHLVAPFIMEQGSHLTEDYDLVVLDARAPIRINKAEMRDKEQADKLFRERRIEATHKLLDFVDQGEVPVLKDSRKGSEGVGKVQVWQWGTLDDWKQEVVKALGRDRGLIV